MAAKKKSRGGAKQRRRPPGSARGEAPEPAVERARGDRALRWWPWIAAAAVILGVVAWQAYPAGSTVPEALRARVVRTHPHDRDAFTQGLEYAGGKLYESTGLRGRSTLREVDLESGEILRRVELDAALFGEGLARVDDQLVQITWQAGKALVWSLSDFEKVREHDYRGEGWGLCYDGERLVMSDGTAWLTFRDPETFERIGEVRVTRAGQPLRRLNELECVDGAVYANVWMTEHIARIDPESGEVTAWIDASGLLGADERRGDEDVLNGIAWMPETGHFLLTGKLWPHVYEVVWE